MLRNRSHLIRNIISERFYQRYISKKIDDTAKKTQKFDSSKSQDTFDSKTSSSKSHSTNGNGRSSNGNGYRRYTPFADRPSNYRKIFLETTFRSLVFNIWWLGFHLAFWTWLSNRLKENHRCFLGDTIDLVDSDYLERPPKQIRWVHKPQVPQKVKGVDEVP